MNKKKKIKFILIALIIAIIIELGVIISIKAYQIVMETAKLNNNETALQQEPKQQAAKNVVSSNAVSSSLPNPVQDENKNLALGTVDISYFDDALFLGDSRTVGLRAFGNFTNSSYFAKTGISVNSFFMYPALDEETGLSLERTLFLRQYKKIYIMIGVNDAAQVPLTEFESEFFDAIEKIREIQPDARIYIQSILGVTKNKEINDPYHYNNERVLERNALLKSKCDGDKLIYLNVFSAFADAEGYLSRECSSDGLHLNSSNYSSWCEYLMNNAIPD